MPQPPNAVSRPPVPKRNDIEGLRALAIILVFGYHLFPQLLPGGFVGVDVFFVISGFLITEHLYREFRATHQLRPLAFYARRIRRLLPASFLVLTFSLIVTAVIAPASDIVRFATGIGASALYVANWFLMFSSTGYAQAGDSPSIIQQYWTLSVEEQFYFFWPLLFVAALFILRRILKTQQGQQWLFPVVLGFVFITSLAASIWFTGTHPEQAFFATFTRVWEFALGGLIACVPSAMKRALSLPRRATLVVAAWIAALAVLASAWILSDNTPFPGYAALWPVLATAILILLGDLGTRWEPARFSRYRPVLFIGGLSYAIYLWHWPIIVMVAMVRGRSSGWKVAIVIVIVTVLAAVGTKYFVENPLRFGAALRTTKRAFAFAAGGSLLLVAGAVGVGYVTNLEASRVPAVGVPFANSNAVKDAIRHQMATNAWDMPAKFAPRTRPGSFAGCLDVDTSARVTDCTFGDPKGSRVLVVIGDSFANQYIPGLVDGFGARGWKVVSLTRSQCPTVDFPIHLNKMTTEYAECTAHRLWVNEELQILQPDIIVASNASAWERGLLMLPDDAQNRTSTWNSSLARYLTTMKGLSPLVVLLSQSPGGGPNCFVTDQPSACPSAANVSWDLFQEEQRAVLAVGATYVDTRDWFCTPDHKICPEAIAGTYVTAAHGDNHVSDQYSRLLANVLYDAITADRQ